MIVKEDVFIIRPNESKQEGTALVFIKKTKI